MKSYIVYDSDGRILKSVSCPEEKIAANAAGHSYMESNATDATHYVDVATGHCVEMPPKPQEDYEFNYTTKQWFDPKTAQERAAEYIAGVRRERDARLFASDWTQMADSPLTAEEKSAWATYRQALRDVPQSVDSEATSGDIIWPAPPNQA